MLGSFFIRFRPGEVRLVELRPHEICSAKVRLGEARYPEVRSSLLVVSTNVASASRSSCVRAWYPLPSSGRAGRVEQAAVACVVVRRRVPIVSGRDLSLYTPLH
jgi:hypothetical protein